MFDKIYESMSQILQKIRNANPCWVHKFYPLALALLVLIDIQYSFE